MTRKSSPMARKRAAGRGPIRGDGITMAKMMNTRLKPEELERIIWPCKAALFALRQARATYDQWVTLCTAGHVARAIEDGGIIKGQRAIIDAANEALGSIGRRCGFPGDTWTPRACTGVELSDLSDLIAAHSRQVHELTYAEYISAADKAVARAATAGGKVFKIEAGQKFKTTS